MIQRRYEIVTNSLHIWCNGKVGGSDMMQRRYENVYIFPGRSCMKPGIMPLLMLLFSQNKIENTTLAEILQ